MLLVKQIKEKTYNNSNVSDDLLNRLNMASQADIWDKKAFPKPCPSEAPFTKPAISTIFKNAGTLLKIK